jgi:hypothetical protein
VFSTEIVDHGGCRGVSMQALAQWRHPVASSEALDVLHWSIRPALYRRIRMAIKIAIDLPAFFVIANSLLPTNIVNNIVIDNLNQHRVRLLFL